MVRQGVCCGMSSRAVVEPLLPFLRGALGPRPWADRRQPLRGHPLAPYRTESPWRDVPEKFAPWSTV